MQRLVCSVNKFSSLVGRWVGVFIKWEKKVDIRSPDTPPLSALDCLFRADFSCKHGGWRASSSPAKPSSQMGGWPFPPLVFLHFFFFPLRNRPLVYSFCFPFWFITSQRRLTRTVWLQRELDGGRGESRSRHTQGEFAGRSCLYKPHWCHIPAWVVGVLAPGRDWTNGANSSKGREPKE